MSGSSFVSLINLDILESGARFDSRQPVWFSIIY